jgi:hypothetical protein
MTALLPAGITSAYCLGFVLTGNAVTRGLRRTFGQLEGPDYLVAGLLASVWPLTAAGMGLAVAAKRLFT